MYNRTLTKVGLLKNSQLYSAKEYLTLTLRNSSKRDRGEYTCVSQGHRIRGYQTSRFVEVFG